MGFTKKPVHLNLFTLNFKMKLQVLTFISEFTIDGFELFCETSLQTIFNTSRSKVFPFHLQGVNLIN